MPNVQTPPNRPAPGWVYVLTNPSMAGLVKIGFTTRNPAERMAELSRATGVATPFALAWCRAVSDCAYVEKAVHRMLADKRVSLDREFFRCTVKEAVQVIEAAAGSALGPRYRAKPRQDRGRRPVGYRRRSRGPDPFRIALAACAVAGLVVALLKPDLPPWLPSSVIHAASALERLHR